MAKKTLDSTQKIKRASITNYKGIRHVEIDVRDTRLYLIGGKNGNGKTSVLNALMTAISGKKYAINPIRNGEKRADITVELDDMKIELHISGDGKIDPVVYDLNSGKKITNGKKVLRTMFGDFAMDPGAFLRLPDRDKIAALKAITVDEKGNPVTFDDLDAKYQTLYDGRRGEKKLLADKQSRLADNPAQDKPPKALLDSGKLLDELEKINGHNQAVGRLSNQHESRLREATSSQQEVDRLTDALKKAQKSLTDREREAKKAEAACKTAGKVKPTDEIEKRMKDMDEINAGFRKQEAHQKAREDFMAQQEKLGKIDRDLEDIVAERKARLASSKFPVEGLAFDEDGIQFKGIPFDDASSSEQLRVSFLIALAGKPQMPVVFVDHGELLDDESQAVLEAEAAKLDAQVFMCAGSRLATTTCSSKTVQPSEDGYRDHGRRRRGHRPDHGRRGRAFAVSGFVAGNPRDDGADARGSNEQPDNHSLDEGRNGSVVRPHSVTARLVLHHCGAAASETTRCLSARTSPIASAAARRCSPPHNSACPLCTAYNASFAIRRVRGLRGGPAPTMPGAKGSANLRTGFVRSRSKCQARSVHPSGMARRKTTLPPRSWGGLRALVSLLCRT